MRVDEGLMDSESGPLRLGSRVAEDLDEGEGLKDSDRGIGAEVLQKIHEKGWRPPGGAGFARSGVGLESLV